MTKCDICSEEEATYTVMVFEDTVLPEGLPDKEVKVCEDCRLNLNFREFSKKKSD